MSRIPPFAALAAAVGLAACAATDPKASTQSPSAGAEDEVMTGSRIPRKSTGDQKAMSKEDWKLETGRGIGNAPRGN